jgi:hypothetical protein
MDGGIRGCSHPSSPTAKYFSYRPIFWACDFSPRASAGPGRGFYGTGLPWSTDKRITEGTTNRGEIFATQHLGSPCGELSRATDKSRDGPDCHPCALSDPLPKAFRFPFWNVDAYATGDFIKPLRP